MKALKVTGPGQVAVSASAPVPQAGDGEVLVRVAAIALNPVDAKSVDLSPSPGATIGCDFAGEVVQVGHGVQRDLHPGDRVFGIAFGNNPLERENAAFAECVVAPGGLLFKIPEGMSFETAASLGVGLFTVGLALYHHLELPMLPPPIQAAELPTPVLIYGAGTATGGLAIQMARRSGLTPVAVCSPRSFGRARELGAAATFDYNSPTCSTDIQNFTQGRLAYALDCISDSASMKLCYRAIGKDGGRYLALDPFPIRFHTRRSIRPDWMIAFTILNKPVQWQRPFQRPSMPAHREFAKKWVREVQGMLDAGAIQPPRHEVVSGRGLEGIVGALQTVRKGLSNGRKLVCAI